MVYGQRQSLNMVSSTARLVNLLALTLSMGTAAAQWPAVPESAVHPPDRQSESARSHANEALKACGWPNDADLKDTALICISERFDQLPQDQRADAWAEVHSQLANRSAEATSQRLAKLASDREEYCRAHQLKAPSLRIGMSEEDVTKCGWGAPQHVNRNVNGHHVQEQWVYERGYLYFEDGKLATIQN
jgi:hypothetical protein